MEGKSLTQDELVAELEAMAGHHHTPFTNYRVVRKLYAVTLIDALKSKLPDDAFFLSKGWQLTQKGSSQNLPKIVR